MSAVTSQSLSTALTVISANIEGLTAGKASILSEMSETVLSLFWGIGLGMGERGIQLNGRVKMF